MPMTTFLLGNEYTEEVSDKNLESLLKEINSFSDNKYRLREDIVKKGLFKNKTEKYYSLYYDLGNTEFQVINFYNSRSGWTINYGVTANEVAAYFYGFLNGRKK